MLPVTASVTQLVLDSFGLTWAATSAGIYVYQVGSGVVNVLPQAANCVWVDGAEKVYVGLTAGGLQESADGGSTWTSEPALAGQTVTSVVTTAPLYSF